MSKSAVVIPSYKRADLLASRTLTLDWVTAQTKYPVFIALRESDMYNYKRIRQKYGVLLSTIPVPDICDTLGSTLDYIMQRMYEEGFINLAMWDDDLVFSKRDWSGTSIPRLPFDEIQEVLDYQFGVLSTEMPYGALRHRAFAQNCENYLDIHKRTMWTHCVHLPTIQADDRLRFYWDKKVMTDFHFHLSVIAAGHQTFVNNRWCADDAVGPYKNSGGCNTYRNIEMRNAAAIALSQEFPSAVTLRDKASPEGSYIDVTVRFDRAYKQWKDSYAERS